MKKIQGKEMGMNILWMTLIGLQLAMVGVEDIATLSLIVIPVLVIAILIGK